jgi:hypothetical protein
MARRVPLLPHVDVLRCAPVLPRSSAKRYRHLSQLRFPQQPSSAGHSCRIAVSRAFRSSACKKRQLIGQLGTRFVLSSGNNSCAYRSASTRTFQIFPTISFKNSRFLAPRSTISGTVTICKFSSLHNLSSRKRFRHKSLFVSLFVSTRCDHRSAGFLPAPRNSQIRVPLGRLFCCHTPPLVHTRTPATRGPAPASPAGVLLITHCARHSG